MPNMSEYVPITEEKPCSNSFKDGMVLANIQYNLTTINFNFIPPHMNRAYISTYFMAHLPLWTR